MWSNQLKMTINCLLLCSAIVIVSGQNQQHQQHQQNQQYNTYNNPYARQQLVYQYDTPPQKTPTHQYLASAPAPFPSAQNSFPAAQAPFAPFQAQAPAHAPAPMNLNTRQNQALISQIVQGSEQFTFDMIYVSLTIARRIAKNKANSFRIIFAFHRLLGMRSKITI